MSKFAMIISILLITISISVAAINGNLTYQGKLTNIDGVGINGNYDMIFYIYDVSTGGIALWSESHSGAAQINLTNGLFSVTLGSITPIDLDFDGTYYLEIVIDGDTMMPRVEITAEGYAIRARYADSLKVASSLYQVLNSGNSTGGLAITNTSGSYGSAVAFDDAIVPASTSNDIGTSSYEWDDIYLSNSSAFFIDGDAGTSGDVLVSAGTGVYWSDIPEHAHWGESWNGSGNYGLLMSNSSVDQNEIQIAGDTNAVSILHYASMNHGSAIAAYEGVSPDVYYAAAKLAWFAFEAPTGDPINVGGYFEIPNMGGGGHALHAKNRHTLDPTNRALFVDGATELRGELYDSTSSAGTAGQVLTSSGHAVKWVNASTIMDPGGSNNQIQYNNDGILSGCDKIHFDETLDALVIGDISTSSGTSRLMIYEGSGPAFATVSASTYAGVNIDRGTSGSNGYLVFRTGGIGEWYVGEIGAGTDDNSDFVISRDFSPADGTFFIDYDTQDIGMGTRSPEADLHIINEDDNYVKIGDAEHLFEAFNSTTDVSGIFGIYSVTEQDSGSGFYSRSYSIYAHGKNEENSSFSQAYGGVLYGDHWDNGDEYGCYGQTYEDGTEDVIWAGYFEGDVRITGTCTGCDLAESWPAIDDDILPGMIVTAYDGQWLKKSSNPKDRNAIGIVSEEYSLLIGNTSIKQEIMPYMKEAREKYLENANLPKDEQNKKYQEALIEYMRQLETYNDPTQSHFPGNDVAVALIGRVPVYVTDENGPIRKGDFITTSSKAGYGMKLTDAGKYIAIALESLEGSDGMIKVKVEDGYYNPEPQTIDINDFGIVKLDGNSVKVNFDNDFTKSLNGETPVITLTANQPKADVYIESIDSDGFTIASGLEIDNHISVNWFAIARIENSQHENFSSDDAYDPASSYVPISKTDLYPNKSLQNIKQKMSGYRRENPSKDEVERREKYIENFEIMFEMPVLSDFED